MSSSSDCSSPFSAPPSISSISPSDIFRRFYVQYSDLADFYFVREAPLDVSSNLYGFVWSPAGSSIDIVYQQQPHQPSNWVATMARTSAWVQQQSTQDQTEASKAAVQDPPVTPPPRSSNHENQHAAIRQLQADPSVIPCLEKQKYDIPTLLKLRYTQASVPVMLRVKPEAIAENIFQYLGANNSHRLPARSRGLSDISNASRGSISSNNNLAYRLPLGSKYPNLPRLQRQAPSPIDIPSTQRQDGFVRFLQQHASPPHHRVTAGGRIVPAGPTSPPPMLDYGSLNGLVREQFANAEASQKEGRSFLSALKPQNVHTRTDPSMLTRGYPPGQANNVTGQSGLVTNSTSFALYDNLSCGLQPISPAIQGPAAIVPIGTFPDGTTVVSYNGSNYRTYWNGSNTVMEPLQSFSVPVDTQHHLSPYPPAPYTFLHYPLPIQNNQATNMSVPLANITNGSRGSNRKTSDSLPNQESNDKESELRTQLGDLDKHLALYHFEIAPSEHAQLIAQRRCLVEAIDQIRVRREKTKRSIPIITPAMGLPITPIPRSVSDQRSDAPRPMGMRITSSRGQKSGKGLSPAAMPFVPKKTRNLSSDVSTKRNLDYITNAAIARKDKALNFYDPSGSTQVTSHREESTSSVLDPSDPAMRVVDYDDIEYASRYLFNWNLDKNTYCTTVAEFQEAIRRVREQARLYGCLGGQSKDPAYDAEQDIWWAICDRDPIPLPSEIPDHISKPRPWNWQDSAFNVRRNGMTFNLDGFDNARNSPRLMGWDPITTESMKDKVDVTRSYYAWKGQLQTVPFRTWAYDHQGNKIAVDSSPTTAAKGDVQPGHSGKARSSPSDTKCHTRTDAMNISRPLKALSVGELDSRNNGINLTSPSKDIEKMHIVKEHHLPHPPSDTDPGIDRQKLPQLAAELDFGLQHSSRTRFNDSRKGPNELRNHEQNPRPYQPYVEDSPDTPASHRSDWKQQSAPMLLTDYKTASKTGTIQQETHAVGKDVPFEQGSEHSWERGDSGNASYLRSTPSALGDHSAETRSQWGPEEDATSIEDIGLNGYRTGAAKVKIPVIHDYHPPSDHDSEMRKEKCVNVPISENSGAHYFLRKMLQSPTYASPKRSTGIASGIANRLSRFLTGGGEGTSRPASKENGPANDHLRSVGSKFLGRDTRIECASALKSNANISVTKAQSFLAPSSYQAHGYLAHVNGTRKDHASSLYGYQSDEAASQQAPVSLPSTASHGNQQLFPSSLAFESSRDWNHHDVAANYHTPVGFGCDGGADSQTPDTAATPKAANQSRPNFDYQGVTHADFENKREDHDNTWHKGAVRDFFHELAANERQEMLSYLQSSVEAKGKGKGKAT